MITEVIWYKAAWKGETPLHTSSLLCAFQFTLHQIGLDSVNSINDYIESLHSLIVKTGGQLVIAYGFNDCNFEEC